MEFFQFDDDYVRRLRAGDRDTEEHMRSYFEPLLVAKFRGRVPPSEVADLVQDVFVAIIEAILGDKGPADGRKFGAWVHGIAVHLLSNWYRAHKTTTDSFDPLKHLPPDPPRVLSDIILRELKEKVHRVLDALRPSRDAKVLRAIFIDERDKDDVCAEFGIDRNYLRVLVYRALSRFRDDFTAPPRPPDSGGEVKRFPENRH
jgi:RNA polymerase sigma-70 factor (ECF subfamily)